MVLLYLNEVLGEMNYEAEMWLGVVQLGIHLGYAVSGRQKDLSPQSSA